MVSTTNPVATPFVELNPPAKCPVKRCLWDADTPQPSAASPTPAQRCVSDPNKRKAEHLYGVSDESLVFAKRGAVEPIEPDFKLFPLRTGHTKLIPLIDDEEMGEASSPKQPPAVWFSPAQTPLAQTTSYSPTQPFPFNNILFPEDEAEVYMPPLALTLPASSQQTPPRVRTPPVPFLTPPSTLPSAPALVSFLTPPSTLPSAPALVSFLTPLCPTTLLAAPKCMRKTTKYPTETPT
ncbi:hypothetical protein T484DRAFT_1862740 [Baffinella frigidus]|nr:hypothetical protein T484DRAFT_1862740 [Cryptophyta sp. CCMP2293]